MEAVLKIFGDIGEADPMMDIFGAEDNNISTKKVADFLDQNKEATDITVRINSRGGDVQEGWGIYDLLTTSGKKIKTIGETKIYSIATIIYLAGDEREIMKNADGLIHNPFIPPYTLADKYESDDLAKIAKTLAEEEDKILNLYVERTGTPADKLAEYMKEDTMLSSEDMFNLGFATKIIEPVKAFAYFKPKNNQKMDAKEVKSFGEKIDTLIAKISNLSRLSSVDQTFKDSDGKEFNIEKETGSPAVGDKATPDGTYNLDGKKIVIAGGEVTEVTETEAEAESELKAAQDKIVVLETKISDMETVKAEAETAKTEAEAAKTESETAVAEYAKSKEAADKIVAELTSLKNSWKPDSRSKNFSSGMVGGVNVDQVKQNIKAKQELNQKSK